MALLDEVLAHNDRFVSDHARLVTKVPEKRIVLFTCMDTRLVEFLEPAMGLKRGDAKIIKNAGTTIIDPYGGVIRSLVVAIYALGCEEIFIVGHQDCGMGQIDVADLEQRMLLRGVAQAEIGELHPGLGEWLGTFKDGYENIRRVARVIQGNPLIPRDVPVHGMMFDPVNGRLQMLVNGYERQSAAL